MDKTATEDRVLRTAQGSAEALAELYEELRKPVYLHAYAVLGSHALAEDAAQETFLKVMTQASSYRPTGSAKAWVLRIARNTALDMLRRERRGAPLHDGMSVEEDGFSQAEGQLDFLAAIKGLDDRDKSIVIFKAFAGLRHAEVAKALGMSEVAVRVRYHRILKKLRQHYEGG